MKTELDVALVRDFPLLFAARHKDMRATAMCWGFECGDGWEPLIRELASKLEPLIKKFKEEHSSEEHFIPCASQVKEKYGTLRFYMHSETEEMSKLINDAETKSETTCEVCGKPGKIRGQHWVYTACEEHKKDD